MSSACDVFTVLWTECIFYPNIPIKGRFFHQVQNIIAFFKKAIWTDAYCIKKVICLKIYFDNSIFVKFS